MTAIASFFSKLTRPYTHKGGRNRTGRITNFHMGGGSKRRSPIFDFSRTLYDPGLIRTLGSNKSGTSAAALVSYPCGAYSYFILPRGVSVGDVIVSNTAAPAVAGNSLPLFFVPDGADLHNLPFFSSTRSFFSRCAGSSSKLLAKYGELSLLALPSGEHRFVPSFLFASVGIPIANRSENLTFRKAGQRRQLGIRPKSRGVATNPVDHPHGGRTQRGRPRRSFSFTSIKFRRTASKGSKRIFKSRRSSNFIL